MKVHRLYFEHAKASDTDAPTTAGRQFYESRIKGQFRRTVCRTYRDFAAELVLKVDDSKRAAVDVSGYFSPHGRPDKCGRRYDQYPTI